MDPGIEYQFGSFRCMHSANNVDFHIRLRLYLIFNHSSQRDSLLLLATVRASITLYMKNYKQLLLILTAVWLTMSNCRKNGEDIQGPTPLPISMKWVKKIIAGPNDYFAYSYTDQKQVNSYTSKWTFSPDGPIIHTYQVSYEFEEGKVKEAITTGNGKQLFYYQNNQLESAAFFYPNGKKYAEHSYIFNSHKQLTEIVESIVEPIEVSQVRTQLFYDSKGNLVKKINQHKKKGAALFETTSTLLVEEYDNKYHPIPGDIWGQYLPGLIVSRNNPTRIKDLLPDGSVRQIVHMSYEYDSNGYPVVQHQHLEINGEHKPSIRYTYEY